MIYAIRESHLIYAKFVGDVSAMKILIEKMRYALIVDMEKR